MHKQVLCEDIKGIEIKKNFDEMLGYFGLLSTQFYASYDIFFEDL